MIYLSSFALSDKKVKNPNLYPYSVFQDKDCDPFMWKNAALIQVRMTMEEVYPFRQEVFT